MDPGERWPWAAQDRWAVRFEWGPAALAHLTADAVVLVDVLRFTTAVDAAAGRGATVLPCRWDDGSAAELATRSGAVLADPRATSGPSLSPVSLLRLGPGDRLVLPSLNGSHCSTLAARSGATVAAACLRNAAAVAAWLDGRFDSMVVVACGERWPDGSLRPAIEDLLGAGAVIAGLGGARSPEAEVAAAAWRAASGRVSDAVRDSASGREAIARGWERDVRFAAEVDASPAVPVLRDGGFVDVAADRA